MIALLIGLGLGVVTGLPVGIVNVAIVEAAHAGRGGFARRLGFGGALADAIHAGVAFIGVGRVIEQRPEWRIAMAIATGAVIAMYATHVVMRRRRKQPPTTRGGVLVGFLLTLPNPGALAAWIAVAAVVWPSISPAGALALAAGVGAGSAVWFTALATITGRAGSKKCEGSTPGSS